MASTGKYFQCYFLLLEFCSGLALIITCLYADGNDPVRENTLMQERRGRVVGIMS